MRIFAGGEILPWASSNFLAYIDLGCITHKVRILNSLCFSSQIGREGVLPLAIFFLQTVPLFIYDIFHLLVWQDSASGMRIRALRVSRVVRGYRFPLKLKR